MAKSKKSLLYEFSQTREAQGCRSIGELEERFSRWLRRNNISLMSHGRDYFENNFYSSANYTLKLLRDDPNLLYSFGLDESHLVKVKPDYRDNIKDGYSLRGQFQYYGNRAHNRTQDGEYRKNGTTGFFKGGVGKVILAIVVVVLLYKLVGDTVWNLLTDGAIFKFICMAIAAVVTYAIFRAKNMGWPFGIKLVVVIVIWVVLFNYDF